MIRVVVETPYAGRDYTELVCHVAYLRACLHDCFLRGEAPFASHGLYTQPGVLRDNVPGERALGIEAGFEWREAATKTVVYHDYGITEGMRRGIEHAARMGQEIEFRKLPSTIRFLPCTEAWP